MKYSIIVYRAHSQISYATVEVDADSEDLAITKAIEKKIPEKDFTLSDHKSVSAHAFYKVNK